MSFLGMPAELAADEEFVDARVVLEGQGIVETHLTIQREADGELIAERTERVRIDGRTEHTFDDLEVPTSGRYRLTLEVSAPGIRQSQSVTVTKR